MIKRTLLTSLESVKAAQRRILGMVTEKKTEKRTKKKRGKQEQVEIKDIRISESSHSYTSGREENERFEYDENYHQTFRVRGVAELCRM
jgi:hypothetical protein